MRAMGVLPTEERWQSLNEAQIWWLFENLQKDERERAEEIRMILDHIEMYINPEAKQQEMKQRELEESGQVGFGRTYEDTDYDYIMELAEKDPEAVKKYYQDLYNEMKQYMPEP